MKDIESVVSPLVQAHFPSFYEQEGARFIDFVKEYYRWMESEYGTDVTFNANTSVDSNNSITISSGNNYVVGDTVRYYVDAGNTALANLTSNNIYYVKSVTVYDANNTALSLSVSPTSPTLTLTKGVTEQGHHLVGPLGNRALHASRNLFNYRDIDKTSDEFVKYFKEKYLRSIPLTSIADTRRLVKNSTDLYDVKGTAAGVKLVIQGLYDQEASVYFPGTDILRASDGTWTKPVYLELSVTERTKTFIGQEVVGVVSGAKAFVESVVRRRIGQRYLDVAYLSGVRGDFQTNERITTTANTVLSTDAPWVVGSMTTLDVLTGGAEFAVGDIFDVVSSKGKQGKARVTSISNATGAVFFEFESALVSGGWGYSTNADVLISSKVLTVSSKTNANTLITDYTQFETVEQILANIAYTVTGGAVANNLNFDVGTVVENYDGGGAVVANAVIVSTTKSTNTTGYIIVAPNVGNVAVDSTFSLSGNGTTASIGTYTNRTVTANLIATNSTAVGVISVVGGNFIASPYANLHGAYTNTTGTITAISTGTGADFDVGSITETETVLLNPDFLRSKNSGNVVFVSTPTTGILLNGFNANTTIYGTDVTFNANTAVDATTERIAISSASNYIVGDALRYYVDTGNTALTNLTSNTVYYVQAANSTTIALATTAGGSAINLTKGLSESGHHIVGPLRILTTGDVQHRGIGFIKFPSASLDAVILDCLRLESMTIGSIASLTGLNPGSDYNTDPFVVVIEPFVYGYDKHDYIMTISSATGTFAVGERIEQSFSNAATILNYTNFSGTDAQGVATTAPIVGEYVFQANATHAQAATGYVHEFGGGAVKLKNTTGTFTVTATSGYQLQTQSSGATANITTITSSTIATTARGLVKEIVSSTLLKIKRINLEQTFTAGGNILGRSSGTTATIDEIGEDLTVPALGVNANIGANVQTANNVVTGLEVVDSGYGYEDEENVTLTKTGSSFAVTARVHHAKQGLSEGFFSTTRGFLDSDKKLRDNEYYQEYSYEVQTKIPLDDYIDVLKQITHVAGTRAFGKVLATSFIDTQLESPDPTVQTVQLSVTDGSGTYTSNEVITQTTNTDINTDGTASGIFKGLTTSFLIANTTHAPYITRSSQLSQPTYAANTRSATVVGVASYSTSSIQVVSTPLVGTLQAGSLQANITGNTFTLTSVTNANTVTGSFANNEVVYQASTKLGARTATGYVLPGTANSTSVTVVGISGIWNTGVKIFGSAVEDTSATIATKSAFSSAYTFTASAVINTMDIASVDGTFTPSSGSGNGRITGNTSGASSNAQYVTIQLNT